MVGYVSLRNHRDLKVGHTLKQAATVGRRLHGLKRSLRERTRAGQ